MLTGKSEALGDKLVLMPLCAPKISPTLALDRILTREKKDQSHIYIYIHTHRKLYIQLHIYTGCFEENLLCFGRTYVIFNYIDMTKNTYIR